MKQAGKKEVSKFPQTLLFLHSLSLLRIIPRCPESDSLLRAADIRAFGPCGIRHIYMQTCPPDSLPAALIF